MPAPATIRYTYEDWLAIPEDNSRRYEILDGELFVNPPPRARHQDIAINVAAILFDLTRVHGLGKVLPCTGVRLGIDTVVEPDVLFIASSRLGIVDWDGCVLGAPDVVVEVLSPSNRAYDRTVKRKHYMLSGVSELWIVDPDEGTLDVWRPGATEPERPEDVVTWRVGDQAFEIPLAEIFRH